MSSPADFAFIVGAPRCGTTSLARYLEAHPDVCFSYVKEPHYFAQYDLRALGTGPLRRRIEEDYLRRYFRQHPGERPMFAEGSVSYLYAASQMEPILRLWPQARFIICLRDPCEMLPSLHQRLVFNGDETVTDFAEAWSLMDERANGRQVPTTCFDARSLQYAELARLGRHVERFLEAVGREKCRIVLFEDFIADPAATWRGLLDFLGLPDDGRREFPIHRGRLGYKLAWLQRLLKRPPVAVRQLLGGEKLRQRIKPLYGHEGTSPLTRAVFAARARLLDWNEAPAPPRRLPDELRRAIAETLATDVERLSRVIGRDLGHWLDGAPSRQDRPPIELPQLVPPSAPQARPAQTRAVAAR